MFIYKGKNSNNMGLRVLNDLLFTSPERDVNLIQVPGRNGDLVVDNGRFNSVVRSIPCRLDAPNGVDIEQAINDINNWLVDDGGFHEFEWNNDPDFVYQAKVDGGVISSRLLSRLGQTEIDFRMHPIKYLKSSMTERPVSHGENIINRFAIDANPIIRIVRIGDGDITFNVGGRPVDLRQIADGCVLDSETQTITDITGRVTLFELMYSGFPILKPGNNTITFSNNIQVFITPRLGALL